MVSRHRTALRIALDFAIDRRRQHVEGPYGHALHRHRIVEFPEAGLDQADPGLVLAMRKMQLPCELADALLPDAIGELTALLKLHVYGDRTLKLPMLNKVSPASVKCTEIEELLLNQNDLTTLPVEIAKLQKLRNLSVAENHLAGLPPEVTAWAQKFDPKGLADQSAP